MRIVVFGRSCAGKSTLADALQKRLGYPFRSCGKEIRLKAAALGLCSENLSLEDHRQVDTDTLGFAQSSSQAIIEGRYLNYVLSKLDDTLTVELRASLKERNVRRAKRVEKQRISLVEEDAEEDKFRLAMYPGREPRAPAIILDTSLLSPAQCEEIVVQAVRNGK